MYVTLRASTMYVCSCACMLLCMYDNVYASYCVCMLLCVYGKRVGMLLCMLLCMYITCINAAAALVQPLTTYYYYAGERYASACCE